MAGYRAERISQRIHEVISVIFERGMSDPRLVGIIATRVEVSGDLRLAKIFVAPMPDPDETKDMLDGLVHANGYIRHQIAVALDLKFAPEIRFLIDHAYEKTQRFLQALDQVQAEERAAQGNQDSRKKMTEDGGRKTDTE
jgi:ribosome-binding factor A